MNIILYLLIGGVAGWLAGLIVKGRGSGVLGNVIVGIIGGFLGGVVLGAFGLIGAGLIGSLVTALVGAVILLFLIGLLRKKM